MKNHNHRSEDIMRYNTILTKKESLMKKKYGEQPAQFVIGAIDKSSKVYQMNLLKKKR